MRFPYGAKRIGTKRRRFSKTFAGPAAIRAAWWQRNGLCCAPVRVKTWQGRVALEHAKSVAEATRTWQDLKSLLPPPPHNPLTP